MTESEALHLLDLENAVEAAQHEARQARLEAELARADLANAKVASKAAVEAHKAAAARAFQEATLAENRLRLIETSTIWKASWPIRSMMTRAPLLRLTGRRAAQAVWWTTTLQLFAKLRARKRTQGRWEELSPSPKTRLFEFKAARAQDIVIAASEEPIVSVIIPAYGQVDHTLGCLTSIAAYPPRTAYEVIVAEDASGDPRTPELRSVRGIRFIENADNVGFLRNANGAAAQAKGEFLLFLNNDTQIQEDALDQLVDLLSARPDAAAAGAKLVYPDGRLQEAGGIIWSDASGWNYGRLGDPAAPTFNYVREVDYVSGAALMVRRSIFEALGGFDEHFAPAYYEDTDLAFRIRRSGFKVLYQPRSVVMHFEGVSHGSDEASGIKAIQPKNREKFLSRWAEVLSQAHFPSGTQIMRASEHGRGRNAILIVDHYVPEPDRDAGSRLMFGFARALIDVGWLVKFWPDDRAYRPNYTEALQDLGVEVLHGGGYGSFDDWLEINGDALDIALLSRPDIADRYISSLRRHCKARLAFFGHDLHFARLRMQAQATNSRAVLPRAAAMEALERSVWRRSDIVLYPSAEETAIVSSLEPGVSARAVVPYAFDTYGKPRSPVRTTDILFVAGFAHPPNEDAAIWFAEDILPGVRRKVPEARLLIVGSKPTESVKQLANAHIAVHADVDDAALEAFYLTARVAVVPLRFGAGVKLKVAEALQQGLPLVTTPVGAQGCPGLEGVVSVHDDAMDFASAVCQILQDDDAWTAASTRQVAYAKAHFSRQAVQDSLVSALLEHVDLLG